MAAGVHPLVQDADDLDKPWLDRTIVENMRRGAYSLLRVVAARMPQVKAPHAGQNFAAVLRPGRSRIRRHSAHRGREDLGIAAPSFEPPPLGAGREDMREIGLRRPREAKARHRIQGELSPAPVVNPSR
jgi:hypothetical protein